MGIGVLGFLIVSRPYIDLTLRHRMRLARETVGLKQTDIAELLEVSSASVSRWENSEQPPMYVLWAYSAICGVDIGWLCGNDVRVPTLTLQYPPGDSNPEPVAYIPRSGQILGINSRTKITKHAPSAAVADQTEWQHSNHTLIAI